MRTAMLATMLLMVAVHLLPMLLAWLWAAPKSALEVVAYGAEAAVLWASIFAACSWLMSGGARRINGLSWRECARLLAAAGAIRYVAAWGSLEGAERAVCRLAFPLDRKPPMPVEPWQNLCDVATGYPVSLVSCAIALVLVALLNRRMAPESRSWPM